MLLYCFRNVTWIHIFIFFNFVEMNTLILMVESYVIHHRIVWFILKISSRCMQSISVQCGVCVMCVTHHTHIRDCMQVNFKHGITGGHGCTFCKNDLQFWISGIFWGTFMTPSFWALANSWAGNDPQSLHFDPQFFISSCFRGHPRPLILRPSATPAPGLILLQG